MKRLVIIKRNEGRMSFGFGECSECGGSLHEHESGMCSACRNETSEDYTVNTYTEAEEKRIDKFFETI